MHDMEYIRPVDELHQTTGCVFPRWSTLGVMNHKVEPGKFIEKRKNMMIGELFGVERYSNI